MMLIVSQIIYKFNAILIKIPIGLFKEPDKLTPNFIGKSKGTRIVKAIF